MRDILLMLALVVLIKCLLALLMLVVAEALTTQQILVHCLLPSSLLCVCSFGVLMLVVITGRSPRSSEGEKNGHILRWVCLSYPPVVRQTLLANYTPQVEDCVSSNNPTLLKDQDMDAPDDAVLRLAQLALRCTVQRTASRPSMATIANELQGIRHEVVGKEVLSAAVKVDEQAEGMRSGMSYPNNLAAMLEAIKSMEEESTGEQSGII
ncbi:unnamed protein product [Closterium sp. NIES-65]|nr:unnamed protein product [Closterium sp. NIES-65]